jgi:hypothetical protein
MSHVLGLRAAFKLGHASNVEHRDRHRQGVTVHATTQAQPWGISQRPSLCTSHDVRLAQVKPGRLLLTASVVARKSVWPGQETYSMTYLHIVSSARPCGGSDKNQVCMEESIAIRSWMAWDMFVRVLVVVQEPIFHLVSVEDTRYRPWCR